MSVSTISPSSSATGCTRKWLAFARAASRPMISPPMTAGTSEGKSRTHSACWIAIAIAM